MRLLASLALLVALVALGFAAVAFTSGESLRAASNAGNAELAAAKQRANELEQRLDKLQVRLDASAKPPAPAPNPAVAAAPGAPVVAEASAPAVSADDAHIKEVVDAEVQAQFQKMRAQWGGGPGGGGPAPLTDAAAVKAQLGVDDQKAEQTAKIIAEMRAAVREVWRGGGDRDANTKKMQELRADADTKLAAVLSADELAKAKQLLDQQGRRGRNQGQGGDAAAPPAGDQPAPPKGTSF